MIADQRRKDKADTPKPQPYKGDPEDLERFIRQLENIHHEKKKCIWAHQQASGCTKTPCASRTSCFAPWRPTQMSVDFACCCNLAKLYVPVAISQSFTFLLQSRKALRSGRDFCPIRVQTLLHSTMTLQCYIWRILYHVEDSCTFTFITHRCNIWLGT